MLNKNHSSAYNALKALLVLPLLALFLYSFNLKTEKKFVELPMEPKVEKVMEKEKGNHSEDLVSSNLLDIKEVPETQVQAQPISTPSDKPVAQTLIKEFKFLITKNTTDAELASLKKKLKEEHNIDLNYSNSRNSAGEITSLSISYSGNGKNGNYQVTDDEGIETFTFYMSAEGETGFYSDSMEARKSERRAQMKERKMVVLEEMETRREAMEQRREDRNKQLRVEMEERKKNREDRRKEIRVRISDEEEELEDNIFELERTRSDRDGKVIVIDKLGKDVDFEVLEHPETVYVKSIEKSFGVITKNTTNEDLENLKRKLAKEDVDFSYRNVRRNSKGEITGLKFSVKDDNGKSTTHVKGNNNDPIDTIIIR